MNNKLIKNKNFVLVFLGALVSNIGSLLYNFAVSLYLLEISNNNAFIQGVYLAMCGITFVLFSFIGGIVTDRFHNGKIMYLCDYIKGIIIILCTFLLITVCKSNNAKIVILFIVGFFSNIIASIFGPASSSIIPKIVDENNISKANSLFSILQSCQSIIGIILAGILYSFIDINILFLIVGICYLLSGLSEMFIKYNFEKKNTKITIKDSFMEISDGFKYLKTNKYLFALILSCLFINFFSSPVFENLIPYFIKTEVSENAYFLKEFITPEIYYSMVSIFFAVGSLIAGIVLSSIVIKKYVRILKIGLFNIALGLIILTITYIIVKSFNLPILITMIAFCLVGSLIGVATTQTNVPTSSIIQISTKKDMLGKVMCFINIGSQGLVPLASFIAGIILKYFQIQGLFIFSTVGFIIVLVTVLLNKNIKEDNINTNAEVNI